MANTPTDVAPAAPSGHKPGPSPHLPANPRRWPPQPWWLVFLVLMIVNYVGTRVFFREASSITVPYTFFKAQIDAGNVEDVTSVGDAIHGRFKTKVTYPPPKAGTPAGQAHSPDQPDARTSTEFKTQRPIFAGRQETVGARAAGDPLPACAEPDPQGTSGLSFRRTLRRSCATRACA